MKKILLFLLPFLPLLAQAQGSRVYYPSNYLRVVQPDVDDSSDLGGAPDLVSYSNPKIKADTLLNPFTGGFNNATFFNVDFNGDGIQDLYVFDREANENQFFLFQGLSNYSTLYRYAPQYHYAFPQGVHFWVEMADYNNDGLPDLFSISTNERCNTCIEVYKNTSYFDQPSGKYIPQFKVVADPLYFYDSLGNKTEVDVPQVSNPQFVDIDKDGYLDILAFDNSLNAPQFFRNRGKNGTDSLSFYYTKQCWGYFQELTQHHYTPWNCEWVKDNIPPAYGHPVNYAGTWDPDTAQYHSSGVHSTAHFNNSMLAFDVDCDGDIDLLLGDGLNDSLAFLQNGNIDHQDANAKGGYHRDTITNISDSYNNNNFPRGFPAIITNMPTPSLVDINHDTLNDLVVAAGQPSFRDTDFVNRLNNIWYYTNYGSKDSITGKPTSNVFEITSKDFLQNTMVDWGINSAPCFIDVDNDGRKDLILAVRDGGANTGFSHLVLYLNKAGKTPGSKPYLQLQNTDYLGFSKLQTNILYPVPAAYFNAKSSTTDLLIGNFSGQVMYYKNDGNTNGKPANFHRATSALLYKSRRDGKMYPIDDGSANSAPTAADINGDGKMDLLIGSSYGTISYYRCLGYLPGTDNVPYFDSVTSAFGGFNATSGTNSQTAPCVADMDKNGKPDLLVGDKFGYLWYFHDFDTTSILLDTISKGPTDYLRYLVQVHDYGSGKDSNRILSGYTIPSVAYLDSDTFPDIMLGCIRGGLIFLGSENNGFENLRNNSAIQEPVAFKPTQMGLFPNPAKDMVTLEYNNPNIPQNAKFIVSDMLGRQVIKQQFLMQNGKGDVPLSTLGLANGIYIVNVESTGQMLFSNKLVIYK